MQDQDRAAVRNRLVLAAVGGIAGLAFWLFVDVLDELIENARLFAFLFTLTFGFFGTLLAVVGPLTLRRAAGSGLVVALPSAALLIWASFRFDTPESLLDTGYPLLALALLLALPLPFLICLQRPGEGWRAYAALFDQAWAIVVRYAAAWIFVGVVWAVIYLSDALLGLVGLTVIEDLLDIDGVPFVVTGVAFGLSIAVVNELSDYVSPYLILRLLRLLLPAVLLVVLVFIFALPFRGLTELFGQLSAATILMAIAVASITLVTIVVAKDDVEAAHSAVLRGAGQGLALTIPVIAGLALYAIWLRVDQYGWTPDRITAALVAGFATAYALSYALWVLLRHNWMARIRDTNTYLALAMIGIAALYLTPVLNAERISVTSQLARYEAGRTDVDTLDLWEIGRVWGRAGTEGLERLSAMDAHPDAERLRERLARLQDTHSRYEFEQAEALGRETPERALLRDKLQVFGSDGTRRDPLPEGAFALVYVGLLNQISEGCERKTPGNAPGCVAVLADLLPHVQGDELIVAHLNSADRAQINGFRRDPEHPGFVEHPVYDLSEGGLHNLDAAVIDQIRNGAFRIAPAGMNVLRLDNTEIFIQP